MTLQLPEDSRGQPAQVYGFKDNGAHQIDLTGAAPTARNTAAFTSKIIRVWNTGKIFFKIGDNTVTADNTDHFYLGNADGFLYINLKGTTHISFHSENVAVGGTTTVYVSEIE